MDNTTKNSAMSLAARNYLKEIWQQKPWSIIALLLPGIGTTLTVYVPPLIIAAMIVRFENDIPSDLHEILPYLGAFAGVWLLGEALWRIAFWCLNRVDATAMKNLYVIAMGELFKKDIGFFHDNFAGALTKKVVGYSRNFEAFMDTLSMSVFANILPLVFVAIVLWSYSPLLALTLIGMMSLVILILVPLIKRRQKLTIIREAASNKAAGTTADIIGNMEAVQAFAHEDLEAKNHARDVEDYTKKARKSWDYHNNRIEMTISPLYVLINVVGLAVAIMFGDDAGSIAAIFITFSYFSRATHVLFEFNRIYRNIENSLSEAGQFTALMLTPSALKEASGAQKLAITQGEIEFRNVDFAYPDDPDNILFENLNLHIRAGEKIALVGHSGGGKSTITKLLLRFVDVTGGELLIDGQSSSKATLRSLRSSIAYVPQDPLMFHRSIQENIRYGKLDATDHDVQEAAKKAHAAEFINKLRDGYDTMVGERGVKLSGGQRQRVAIARAMIKDAPILVLDEATSALDSESEKHIQDALWKLMEGRTTIVIAHRLSTIQKMDRIIVLDNGKIIEQGSHKELLAKKHGTYAKLWAHQSGGFIEE